MLLLDLLVVVFSICNILQIMFISFSDDQGRPSIVIMDESIAIKSTEAVKSSSDTIENSTAKEPTEVGSAAGKSDVVNVMEPEVHEQANNSDVIPEQNIKTAELNETPGPEGKGTLSHDTIVADAENDSNDNEQEALDTEKNCEMIQSKASLCETTDNPNIPSDTEQANTDNVKSDDIEKTKQNVISTSDISLAQVEGRDSIENQEDNSKENKDSGSAEQETDVKEKEESENKELTEIKTGEEKDKSDPSESVENVQKYIDETSNEELENKSSSNTESIAAKQDERAELSDITQATGAPIKSGSEDETLNEKLVVSPKESNKETVVENKTQNEKLDSKEEVSEKESDLKFDSIEDSEKPSVPLLAGGNSSDNEAMDVDSDTKIIPVLPSVEKKQILESSKSPKRKVTPRPRRDPVVPGAPLSLSKLYYLDSETNFTGFFPEYYDSTIYLYQGYWNYVQKEFNIPSRDLPKYKTTFYLNYTPAVTQPVVQTSSGRVVKKKELKEFTPSVPSSHQISRKEHVQLSAKKEVATPKKESPSTKKDVKKDSSEENSRRRYRIPLEKFGWKREVIFRRNNHIDSKNMADVYYYSPAGKKLRSIREIIDNLPDSEELKPFHFTFVKELLGFGSPLEVSREAMSRTLTKCDEDTPKRVKTVNVNRKVFSLSSTSKTDPSKVSVNGKVKKLPTLSSQGVKRTHDQIEDKPSTPSPEKPTNGDILKTELTKLSKPHGSPLFKMKSPADAKHRKLSTGNKTSSDGEVVKKIKTENTQSENKVPNALVSKHKSSDSLGMAKSPSNKKRKEDTPAVVKPAAAPVIRKVAHSNKNLINDISNQFNSIVYLCRYLRVEDLLRVAQINRMFNAAAHSHQLWQVVKLKNSKVILVNC